MDFHTMKRKELQALCKEHSIPANLTNIEMANRLASLLQVEKEKPKGQRVNSVKSCLKNVDDLGGIDEKNSEDKLAKRVRFSPQDQTFEFEKTNPRALRLARRKSIVIADDKINKGEEVSAVEDVGNLKNVGDSADVDNQVKSLRTRGRGRKPEQSEIVEAKAQEIDGSKKAPRKRTSVVVDCEVQPLVEAQSRKKAMENAAAESMPVKRRSVRVVERSDESASLTEQVEIVNLKAPTRCLRRNISKDASVEEVKEKVNEKSRVTRNTRQQKGDIGLSEAVSATEIDAIVEKASTRAEQVKEQGSKKARVTRNTRQQKGDIGLNEAVSATESDAIVEKASTRAEQVKEQGNKKARVTRNTRQQKGEIGLSETVLAAEVAAVVEKTSTRAEQVKEQGNKKARVARNVRQMKGEIGLSETGLAAEGAAVVEKTSTRSLKRNTSKDAGGKAVEEAKEEWGNKKARATRKGDTELNGTVSATESAAADVVEQGQQRRSTRVAIKRCSLAPGELNGKKSDADVQERGVTLKSKQSKKQENSCCPGKSDEQTRGAGKRKLSTKKCVEGLQTDVEVAPLETITKSEKISEAESSEIYSVCEAADIQNRLFNESCALEDNQDNNQSLHQTTPPTPLLKECELTIAEGKTELIDDSNTKKKAPTEPPENAVLSSNEEGMLHELYSLDGQRAEGDDEEADIGKEGEYKEAEILNVISLEDAEVVLHPSSEFQSSPCRATSTASLNFNEDSKIEPEILNGISLEDAEVVLHSSSEFQSSPCRATSTASLSFNEDSKIEPENTVLKADNCVQIDPALTSTSIGTFTGISLPECESGFQGMYHSKLETAMPSSLIDESELNYNKSVEGSLIKNIELEDHTCAKTIFSDEQVHLTWTSGTVDNATAKENQSGDVLEECTALDHNSLESQISKDESTVHVSESYPTLDEFQSWLDKPTAALGTCTLASNEPVPLQADQCIDHLGAHEGAISISQLFHEHTEEAERVTSTPMVGKRSEGIDTCITDRSAEYKGTHKQGVEVESDSPLTIHEQTYNITSFFQLDNAEYEGSQKQGVEVESDSPLTIHEQTYGITSLFQLDSAELDRVGINNELEARSTTKVSNGQFDDNHEDEAEVYEEKACENVGSNQEAEGVTPSAMVDERSEGIDKSDDLGEFDRSHKQGLEEESNSQLTMHEETCGIASLFELDNAERDNEEKSNSRLTIHQEAYGMIASLFQLENTERSSVVTSNEPEGRKMAEVSDGQLNHNHNDEILADQILEVHEEEGESCRETHEISIREDDAVISIEEVVCTGSTTKAHKVSSPPFYYNSKLEFAGLKKLEELTCAGIDYNDKLPAQWSTLNLEEDAPMDEAGESDPQNLTELCSGCTDEKLYTFQQVTTEPTSMHGSEHMVLLPEDQSSEEKDAAVTPNVNLLVPNDLEHADDNCSYEITQVVGGRFACLLEDGVIPYFYSPEPKPVDMSHPMHQEENESNDKNEAATIVLEGSEEKLVLPSSVEEAQASDDNVKSNDCRANVEPIAPSREAVFPVDEMYSTKHLEQEDDFLGLAVLERISEQTGEQSSGEVKGFSLKETEGLASMAKVDEIFKGVVVDSFTNDRIEENAESERIDKQGLTKESNLQFSGHNGYLVEAMVHESSENEDIELTSNETTLLMDDDHFSDKNDALECRTSETGLLISKIDDSEKKEEIVDMDQVAAGDEICEKDSLSSEYTLLASVVCNKDGPVQQKYAFPDDDFLEPEQRKIFEVVTGMIDLVLEDENASTDEANNDMFVDLMKEDGGLVDEISSPAETLEGGNGGTEALETALFPETSSVIPDDEYKNSDVEGITNECVFEGSKQECLIRSVAEANPTAVNMESSSLEGSVELLAPLPQPSHHVEEEMDAAKHTCAEEDVRICDNIENEEFELDGVETDDDTFICEAEELNHITSETGLPTTDIDTKNMEEGLISNEQVDAEQIKQDCDFVSKLQEEAPVPNSHASEICQLQHEDTLSEHCTTFEDMEPAVYDEDVSKIEHEDTCHPEHSTTSELVNGTFEQLGDENASVNQPISDSLQDLKENEVPTSAEQDIRSPAGNLPCCNGESEDQPCLPHQEMDAAMMDDQYKSETVEGISKEDEIMPQQEMMPLNDEISPDVFDEDLSNVELEGISKEDEIMPQQEMKPLTDETGVAKLDKVEDSSRKPASATNQKKRSILIHGTPRRPIKIADMKENSTAQLKRDHLANATASKPLAGRKALGELSRWRP